MGLLATATPAVDLSAVTTALTSSLSAGTITSIIGTVLGASMGLFLVWWGARKLINAVQSAFKNGKVSV